MEGLWENSPPGQGCPGSVGTRGPELVNRNWGLRKGAYEAVCVCV